MVASFLGSIPCLFGLLLLLLPSAIPSIVAFSSTLCLVMTCPKDNRPQLRWKEQDPFSLECRHRGTAVVRCHMFQIRLASQNQRFVLLHQGKGQLLGLLFFQRIHTSFGGPLRNRRPGERCSSHNHAPPIIVVFQGSDMDLFHDIGFHPRHARSS